MQEMFFVCPWFGVFAGGAERAVRNLAIELQRRGVGVEVLTTCSASLYGDWTEDALPPGRGECEGVAVRRFPLNKGRLDRYRQAVHRWASGEAVPPSVEYDFFTYGISSDELVEAVGALPPSSPVVANPYFHALTFRTVVENPGRVHLLGSFHDEPQFSWHPVRDMFREARGILFQAEEEKDLAIRVHGLERGRHLIESPLVGMGIELDEATEQLLGDPQRLRSIRERFGLPAEFFVAVGRKEAGKGVVRLVDWYGAYRARLAARGGPELPLVYLGRGDASLIPESDAFRDLGFVSEEEKFALMRLARATVNLSENEAFCFVLMESWLCGTPVVVSRDCAVTAGHCQRSAGGYAVADEEEFFAALDALEDRELADIAGEAGRQYVSAEYNWDVVTDRVVRASFS
jgi:glycosyltransferase involved in cell wall biosynthesis